MFDQTQVRDKIIEYYTNVLKPAQLQFTFDKEADAFVKKERTAFLFAVILDQGAIAERIWEIPYHLNKIMGHLDVYRIAVMKDEELINIFNQLPSKPRYLNIAIKRIKNAASQVVLRYQGKAENIWNDNPRAQDLQSRFDSFDGIGQKKSSMATRILGMDLNVPIRNWNEIDVSVDEMIMRVFPRTGLTKSNNSREIIETARQLNLSFPGALDYPCWMIGRQWCLPQNPNCKECYIGEVCPKIV
jgi:uncharacterized HhH-GPD family protein